MTKSLGRQLHYRHTDYILGKIIPPYSAHIIFNNPILLLYDQYSVLPYMGVLYLLWIHIIYITIINTLTRFYHCIIIFCCQQKWANKGMSVGSEYGKEAYLIYATRLVKTIRIQYKTILSSKKKLKRKYFPAYFFCTYRI